MSWIGRKQYRTKKNKPEPLARRSPPFASLSHLSFAIFFFFFLRLYTIEICYSLSLVKPLIAGFVEEKAVAAEGKLRS